MLMWGGLNTYREGVGTTPQSSSGWWWGQSSSLRKRSSWWRAVGLPLCGQEARSHHQTAAQSSSMVFVHVRRHHRLNRVLLAWKQIYISPGRSSFASQGMMLKKMVRTRWGLGRTPAWCCWRWGSCPTVTHCASPDPADFHGAGRGWWETLRYSHGIPGFSTVHCS